MVKGWPCPATTSLRGREADKGLPGKAHKAKATTHAVHISMHICKSMHTDIRHAHVSVWSRSLPPKMMFMCPRHARLPMSHPSHATRFSSGSTSTPSPFSSRKNGIQCPQSQCKNTVNAGNVSPFLQTRQRAKVKGIQGKGRKREGRRHGRVVGTKWEQECLGEKKDGGNGKGMVGFPNKGRQGRQAITGRERLGRRTGTQGRNVHPALCVFGICKGRWGKAGGTVWHAWAGVVGTSAVRSPSA